MSRSRLALLLLAFLGLVFFGSLIWAAELSPRGYDWRYQVISSLASPRENPQAYRIGEVGLIATGIVLIFLNPLLRWRLGVASGNLSKLAAVLFFAGAVLLILTGVIVPGPNRWGARHLHEHLAQVSAVCLGLAAVFYLLCLLKEESFQRGRAARYFAGTLVILPLALLLLSRFTLFLAHVLTSGPTYEAIKRSVWCSLALWEWIGAVSIYGFLCLIGLSTPSQQASDLNGGANNLK